MENKSHAFMAGLFAILLGLATLGSLYWFGGKKEASRDYIVVTKQNVGGLNPQAQVRYRGIRVGKVSDIRLDPEDVRNILITIQVNQEVPVTQGTIAKLAYQGITGLAHVLLEDSGKDLRPLKDNEDGSAPRIAMAQSLLDELGEAGPVLVRRANETMAAVNALLNEQNRQRFASLLNNLDGTSSQMKPTLDNLNGTLAQVRGLLSDENVRKLSGSAAEVGPLLAESRVLIGKLQGAAEKLDAAIGDQSASGAAALMPRLNELATDISMTSRQLNRVLKVVEESPQSLVFGAPALQPGPGEAGFVVPLGR